MSEVIIYYLEMNTINDLKAKTESNSLQVIEAEIKDFRVNRFLYQYVGELWDWTDKLSHTEEQWRAYAESTSLHTYIAYYKGAIAGYFELQSTVSGDVEIKYFGLAEKFIGKSFGGYLLTCAIKGTKRIWLHTCSLDHPSAIKNYKARGFKVYKEEIEIN